MQTGVSRCGSFLKVIFRSAGTEVDFLGGLLDRSLGRPGGFFKSGEAAAMTVILVIA